MAGTLILDDDLMVLQRKGDFDIKDDYYETEFPGQFPNIRIDTDIFHFTGEDLRYSVEKYTLDSGQFVKIDGDIMTGDLEIHVPGDTIVATEGGPDLKLVGKRTGSLPYAQVSFVNSAWAIGGATGGRTLTLEGIAPNNATLSSYINVAKTVAITENGDIFMDGAPQGESQNICVKGSGTLNSITNTTWSGNDIAKDIEIQSKRLEWNDLGGNLINNSGVSLLNWNTLGIYLYGTNDNRIEVVGSHSKYFGEVTEDKDIVTKEYADNQDWKYIPLKGTRVTVDDGYQLEQDAVDGAIDFTNDGALNATANNQLRLTKTVNGVDVDKLTIGDNIHIENADLDVNDNKIMNVPSPSELLTDPDKDNAVPKKYIDTQVGTLKDVVDNIADITAPPGMINAYVGNTAPAGWFLCKKGVTYKCGEHPKMHLALAGSQDDIDNNPDQLFSVPDLSGRALVQPGALSNASTQYPAGNSYRQAIDQMTALPMRGRNYTNNSNNYNYYIQVGSHRHSIYADEAQMIFNSNHLNITANSEGSGHTHNYGAYNESKKGGGTSSDNPNAYNSSKTTPSGGAHSHKVTADPTNAHQYLCAVENSSIYLKNTDFDAYNRPYAYTINWIIKHDN